MRHVHEQSQRDGGYLYDKVTKFASMHRAPWNYDTPVPLLFLGRRWVEPGKFGQNADPADIALPSGSEGRVLTEILKK